MGIPDSAQRIADETDKVKLEFRRNVGELRQVQRYEGRHVHSKVVARFNLCQGLSAADQLDNRNGYAKPYIDTRLGRL